MPARSSVPCPPGPSSADSQAEITQGPSGGVAEVAGVASFDEPRGRRHRLAPCAPLTSATTASPSGVTMRA